MKSRQQRAFPFRLSVSMLIVLLLITMISPAKVAFAGVNDVFAYGYNINNSYNGSWTTGNLGKTYEEGEWVAFQTEVRNVDWNTLGTIGVEFDFYDDGRFYDLIRNISVGVDLLPDASGFPMADGTAYPLGTMQDTNEAQRDPNEYFFNNFAPILHSGLTQAEKEAIYMTQFNRAPSGAVGTEMDATRVFYVTVDQIIDAYWEEFGMDITQSDTLVLYFQLHLSRTWIWNNIGDFDQDGTVDYPLAYAYSLPTSPTAKWGGYVYDENFLQSIMLGSYIFPGSSGHSYVRLVDINGQETGAKTIPIPDVEETSGTISGIKFEDVNGNGLFDEGIDYPLPGWTIYLRTDLYAIPDLEFPTITDENGYFEFTNLPYNLIWELSERQQEGYVQTYPNGLVPDIGTYTPTPDSEVDWWKVNWDIAGDISYDGLMRGPFGWSIKLAPPDHLLQTESDFGNMSADPRVIITKEADALSKVGDTVVYTFTVENVGNVDLTMVDIVDDIFGTLDSIGVPGGFEDVLAVGETQTFDYPYIVQQGDSDPLINTVVANYQYFTVPATDLDGLLPSDTHTLNLFQPSITIEKTADTELSKVTDEVNYTITVTNTSSEDSPNLVGTVTDPMLGLSVPVDMAPGDVVVYDIPYVIQEGDSDPLPNTATVNVSPVGFPNILIEESSWNVNLFQPSITIEKTANTELSKVGDDVVYTITVTNTSSLDSPNLIGTVWDSMLGLNAPIDLAPGQTYEVEIPYTVQELDLDPLVNTAYVEVSPEGFPNVLTDEDSWEVNLFQPSIEIEKTADTELSKVSDEVVYTITVTNTSSPDSPNLVGSVWDPMLGLNEIINLAPGQSYETVIPYTVQEGDLDPMMNIAYVEVSPEGFPNVLTSESGWEVNLFQPEISIVKTADTELSKVGDDVVYTITVYNNSSIDSPNLVGNVWDSMLGLDDPIDLAPGQSYEVVIPYTVLESDPDPMMNIAYVEVSPVGFPNVLTDEDSWEVNLFQPIITIEKTADTELSKVGDDVIYTITVTNTSSQDTPNLVGTVWDPMLGLDDPIDLAPGQIYEVEIPYTVQESDPDLLLNTAYVEVSPLGFPNVLMEESSWDVNLFQPGITIEKRADTELSKVGDDVIYTITVTNTSSPDSPNLIGTVWDQMLNLNEPINLAPGETFEVVIPYTVQESDLDPMMNTAYVEVSPDGFPNVLTDEDSWEVNLFQPEIEIIKTADTELSKVGDDVVYTITVINNSSPDSPNLIGMVWDPMLGFNEPINLAPGETFEKVIAYTVKADDPDSLMNTAYVEVSPEGFPNILRDQSSWEVDLFQPEIEIIKTADTRLSKVGDDVVYTITVINNSSPDSPNLVGFVWDSMLGLYEPVDLAPGQSYETIIPYTVQESDLDPMMNTAYVEVSPVGFPNVLTDEDSWEVNLFQPEVEIIKTADTELSKVGDDVIYTITVTNTSSPDSPNLIGTVWDPMLNLSEPINLASGETFEVVIPYTVQESDLDPMMNTAYVEVSPDGFPNVLTDEDSWEVNLFEPGITIEKTANTRMSKATDEVIYTIRVTNTSSADSPNLVGTVTDPMLGLNDPINLAPGAVYEKVINYTVKGTDPDPLVNTATVIASPEGFPNVLEASDTWTVDLFQPVIEIMKTVNMDYSKVGDEVIYTIRVTNTSSADSPNLVGTVTDPMIGLNEQISLAPGTFVEWVIPYIVQPGDSDPMINTATVVVSPEGFPNVLTASDSVEVDLVHPSINIIKTVTPNMVDVGDTVTYQITIENTGDIQLVNISVYDSIFGDLSAFFVDSLPVGGSDSYIFPYTTLDTDPETLVNVATVHANPIGLPNDITATSSAILTIIPVRYETAWAKYEVETPAEPGSIPFEMLGLSNWGWTNGPFEVVPGMQYDMTLYAGQTEFAGYVHVAFFDDRVETTYEAALNVNFTDLHLYMGEDMLPNNGKKYRSSPGQLTWSATANSQTYTFINYYSEIGINPGDYVYIAAHAVVEIR